jgi:hypothetical protein
MLRYTFHARQRMRERGISEQDVEYAHRHPIGNPEPGARPGTLATTGPFPGRAGLLKVVVDSADSELVVTVYGVE